MANFDINSIKVNGVHLKAFDKIYSYKVSYNKVFDEDSGRNADYEMEGTLIGVFPRLDLEIGRLTFDEASELLGVSNIANFEFSWFDFETQTFLSSDYYMSNPSVEIRKLSNKKTEPFSISIIPKKKR